MTEGFAARFSDAQTNAWRALALGPLWRLRRSDPGLVADDLAGAGGTLDRFPIDAGRTLDRFPIDARIGLLQTNGMGDWMVLARPRAGPEWSPSAHQLLSAILQSLGRVREASEAETQGHAIELGPLAGVLVFGEALANEVLAPTTMTSTPSSLAQWRERLHELAEPWGGVRALVTFDVEHLLTEPLAKAEAWRDLVRLLCAC